MDINGNNELDQFEITIEKVSEGEINNIDSNNITQEMVLASIKEQLENNRSLSKSVDHAVYELLRNDVKQHHATNEITK